MLNLRKATHCVSAGVCFIACCVLQIKSIWSVMLRNFDFEMIDPVPDPDYESMVIGPKPARVRFTRRKLQPAV